MCCYGGGLESDMADQGEVVSSGRINKVLNSVEYTLYLTLAIVVAVILLRRFKVSLRSEA
jgi:hypothetical protein